MKYTDEQRIEKMTITTEKLLNYLDTNHISQEDILSQETIRWTITTPLYNIGEHAYALSDEYKENHPEIPWVKIAGLRHRLVHDYDDTNWSLICTILFEVLPEFSRQLKELK